MKSETTAVKQQCEKCGDEVDHFSSDPGLWPVWLCGPGSNGVAKVYHQKCVSVSTGEVDYLRSHVVKIDEENTRLRTQLKSVEAERDQYKHEAEMWDEHMGPLTDYEGDEAPWQTIEREYSALKNDHESLLLRLQEAERLLSEATDDANSSRPVTLNWVDRANQWLKGVKLNE